MLELGSLAGAMVAVITLITKMISLITSIQNLINRLDIMQRDIEFSKSGLQRVNDRVDEHDDRINILESESNNLKEQLKEIIGYAFK